eukprot:m.34628 g.34628  ORF g.34628 m.34628 type:complete len:183 (+) comp12326_c0_seq1:600-1148(+)
MPESFTAVKIVDYCLDLFGAPSLKAAAFSDCIDLDQLAICTLADGSQVAKGDDYKRTLETMAKGWKCEPRKRLFFDNKAGDPTFVLDFYAAGQSPGLDLSGPIGTPVSHSIAVLYRCEHNQCTKIYVALDAQDVVGKDGLDKAGLMQTAVGQQALDLVIRPGGVSGGLELHYHDYSSVPTIG